MSTVDMKHAYCISIVLAKVSKYVSVVCSLCYM